MTAERQRDKMTFVRVCYTPTTVVVQSVRVRYSYAVVGEPIVCVLVHRNASTGTLVLYKERYQKVAVKGGK